MKKTISIMSGQTFDLYSLEKKLSQTLEIEGFIAGNESYRYAKKDFTLVIEVIESL